MVELLTICQGIIERGLIFGLVVASVFISSSLISFDNLSVEGAFGIGGAVTALLIHWNIHPLLALIAATCVGGITGIATGLLHTKLRLNALISGIVITTGLFSITLKIAGSNMILGTKKTVFKMLPSFFGSYQTISMLVLIVGVVFFAIYWFLQTEVGFLLRAVGDSPQMLTNVGKSVHGYLTSGIVLSNALAALGGSLFVQYTGYFSIWASVGILVIGLAGMILAQTISKRFGLALLVGSIAYQTVIALTFELQFDQDWNKLITALLIVILLVVKQSFYKKSK